MMDYGRYKYVFIITWTVLIAYLTIDFLVGARESFWQLNYNWEELEVIEETKISIDSISNDYLRITDDFNPSVFNSNYTYCIEEGSEKYFRATDIIYGDSTISFSGIKWINTVAPNLSGSKTLKMVNLPLGQDGKKTVAMIGDSHIIWREGRDLRKGLSLKNRELRFTGNKLDVYGYPYTGGTFAKSIDIFNEIADVEAVENYLLLFGAHDRNTALNELQQYVDAIISNLSQRRETQKILIVTLPPSPVVEVEKFNIQFNSILKNAALKYDKAILVDLHSYLLNGKKHLYEDQIHLNQTGYKVLTNLIIKALE